MRRPRTALPRWVVGPLTALTVLVGGCGIAPQGEPRALDLPAAARPTPPGPEAERSRPFPVEVVLVREGVLTAVRRDVATRSALSALEALVAGPTRGELGAGLSSVLSPGDVDLSLVSVRGAVVTVPLSGRPGGVTERADALLGYAQVVLTLTRLGAVDGVVFELEGERLTVPRADGSLGAGELRAADYASLLAR